MTLPRQSFHDRYWSYDRATCLGLAIVLFVTVSCGCQRAWAAPASTTIECTELESVAVDRIVSGLPQPFGIAFIDSENAILSTRSGTAFLVDLSSGALDRVQGLPEVVNLFDVTPGPDFKTSRKIYFAYTALDSAGYGLEVGEARLSGVRLESPRVIFEARPKTALPGFSGGRLLFLNDGSLLVSVGDAADNWSMAQDLDAHLGKIVQLDLRKSELGEVPPARTFSLGHRNAQGLAASLDGSVLWASEHGPHKGDEINQIESGMNYGWPIVSSGGQFKRHPTNGSHSESSFRRPIVAWDRTVAPSGICIYSGLRFKSWRGDLFVASLAGRQVLRIQMHGEHPGHEEEILAGRGERIRDIREGYDHFLYVLTDGATGSLLRLRPSGDTGSCEVRTGVFAFN